MNNSEAKAEIEHLIFELTDRKEKISPGLSRTLDALSAAYDALGAEKEAYDKGYRDGMEACAFHVELCEEENRPMEHPCGDEWIGISEDKAMHMLGVARKAYKIAKERGHDEYFCRRVWMLGWVHDVGYEFSEVSEEHPDISARMMLLLQDDLAASDVRQKTFEAVKYHGKYSGESEEALILKMADMQVDHKGREVSVTERLDGIKERYGEHSDQYLTACDVCYRIGLTAVNMASHTV